MVEKFNGGDPLNARIKIDYSGVKPKVNFSYPDRKNQERFSMMPKVFLGWIIIWFFIMFGLVIEKRLLDDNEEEIDFSDYYQCTEHYFDRCDNIEGMGLFKMFWYDVYSDYDSKSLFIVLSFIIPPFLIYFPFRKKWDSLFPKYQAFFASKKIVTFESKDVQHNKDYYCEVPLFSNVILNYDATKDFSKYLKFFEIREHNFKSFRKKRIKGSKKKKRMQNEWLWYAKFYFSKKPVTGKLEVIFK